MWHAPLDRSNFINVANFERRVASTGMPGAVVEGKRGLLTSAIKYEIFKSPPKAGWCMGAWQARVRVQVAKNFGANKGVTKASGEKGGGGAEGAANCRWH